MSLVTAISSKNSKPNSMYNEFNMDSSVHVHTMLLNVEEVKVCIEKYLQPCEESAKKIPEPEDNRITFERDESSRLLPLTPTYSDTSPYNLDNISTSCDSDDYGPVKMRFLVITIAAISFFLQVFSQTIWNAIYEPALEAFPNWSNKSLLLLPTWGSAMTTLLVFPACLTINKFGLKVSLLLACGFTTLGSAVRCLPFISTSTICLHFSAALLAVGGVVINPLIITMSAQWFPKNERNMATGFGSTVGMLGSAASYIVGPKLVFGKDGEPLDPFLRRTQIMHMLYVCTVTPIILITAHIGFGLSIFVTILVFLFFPKYPRPVTMVSKVSMASHQSAKLIRSLKILSSNLDAWFLILAFTMSYTMSAPWVALLPPTFSKLRVPPEISAKCGLFMIIHTFFLSLTISTFADRAPGYSKELALFSRFMSLIFLFWLMLIMNFRSKMTATTLVCVVLMAFPYSWCSQSLLYEMGAELMFPLPESFVAGYMTLLNNLFVDFVYLLLYFYPQFDQYWIHIGVFVFAVLGLVFLLFVKNPSRKLHEKD